MESFHATTIVSVRRAGRVVIGGDGQVTLGNTVMKANARKLRRLGKNADVLAGFAGAAADALQKQHGGPIGMTASEIPNAARSLLNQWIYHLGSP